MNERHRTATREKLRLRDDAGRLHMGYIVFVGACLLMFPQSLPINTASIFFVPVTQELGIAQSTFSVHTTIISLSIFASTALVSALFRRCNLRVFMSCVIVLEAACFFAYALAQSVVVFYVASACIGASLAVLVYLVVPVLVNNWFTVRTSLLIGIGTCMQGIGGVLFNTVGSIIIDAHGWRVCYVVFGLITLAIGIPVSLFMLRRSPQECGLEPVGGSNTQQLAPSEAPVPVGLEARRAYRTACFGALVATCLCLSTAIFFNYYISPYVISLGATIPQAGMASASVMAGMCVGKVVVGAVCDRSCGAGVALGCGAGVVGSILLATCTTPLMGLLCGACFLFGIAYASSSLLGAVLTRHGFGPRDFDRIWPTVGMVIALGNAFGAYFWGAVTENLGFGVGLLLDAGVMGAALVLGLVCTRLAQPLRHTWAAHVK